MSHFGKLIGKSSPPAPKPVVEETPVEEVVEETVDTVTEVVQDGVTVQQPGTVTATATRKVE